MTSKNLVIQIQPELIPISNIEQITQEFVTFLTDISLCNNCHVSRGDENGSYINIELQSENIQRLWEEIQIKLSLNTNDASEIAKGIIVVCEGKKGWNDYLLLYHYNTSEHVDSL